MPKGIRPTQNKVRKALFDILGDIEGLSFLDLFSGSGAMGLEALSQGAGKAAFVENAAVCLKAIEDNLAALQVANCQLLPLDIFKAIERLFQAKAEFNIIFLDPPYYKDFTPRFRSRSNAPSFESLTKKTLKTLSAYDILAPNGFIIAQHFKKENLPDKLEALSLFKQARYADTSLSFYKKSTASV